MLQKDGVGVIMLQKDSAGAGVGLRTLRPPILSTGLGCRSSRCAWSRTCETARQPRSMAGVRQGARVRLGFGVWGLGFGG